MEHKQFEAAVLAYQTDMMRYALFLENGNQCNAEDLAQEAIYLALKYKDRYLNYNMKAWLLTIMNRLHISNIRKRCREQTMEYEQGVSYTHHDDTENAVKLLPVYLQQTFRLLVEGYKYKEIAEKLRVPIGTIKTRINKARSILKKVYKR